MSLEPETLALIRKLDDRHFTIEPTGEKFRGSAIDAKRRALQVLETLPPGALVRVVDSEGTNWCQRKPLEA